eukprot:c31440_g1_i1 orf=98-454(+)
MQPLILFQIGEVLECQILEWVQLRYQKPLIDDCFFGKRSVISFVETSCHKVELLNRSSYIAKNSLCFVMLCNFHLVLVFKLGWKGGMYSPGMCSLLVGYACGNRYPSSVDLQLDTCSA